MAIISIVNDSIDCIWLKKHITHCEVTYTWSAALSFQKLIETKILLNCMVPHRYNVDFTQKIVPQKISWSSKIIENFVLFSWPRSIYGV